MESSEKENRQAKLIIYRNELERMKKDWELIVAFTKWKARPEPKPTLQDFMRSQGVRPFADELDRLRRRYC